MIPDIPPVIRTVRTFTLRSGRMTESQRLNYEELSGRWVLPFSRQPLNCADIFGNTQPLVVEIGFGMGAATAIIARQNPHINYIGIEVHRPGIGRLLGEIDRYKLENLFIIEHDALEVLETMIKPQSLHGLHIFFPDPWPKKRHHKRRLLTRPRTDLLASRLEKNGYLYAVTDWEPYAEAALTELESTAMLVNRYEGYADKQDWRPQTKFERKGLTAQREIFELYFIRRHLDGGQSPHEA